MSNVGMDTPELSWAYYPSSSLVHHPHGASLVFIVQNGCILNNVAAFSLLSREVSYFHKFPPRFYWHDPLSSKGDCEIQFLL